MKLPDLSNEIALWKQGFCVIGIDEVGRGAFAGPLYVAGVIFPPTTNHKGQSRLLSYGINDSKKLTPARRELLSEVIQEESLAYHVSTIEVAQINRIGIGKATFCAMRETVRNLILKIQDPKTKTKIFVLVDGFNIKHLKHIGLKNQKAIIGGDGISLSIAAASVIAKVARDAHMKKLSDKFPAYGWSKNKGYGTSEHRLALSNFGTTRLHRTDFIENFV